MVVLYLCGKGLFANGKDLALITADKSIVLTVRDILAPLKTCPANCLVMIDFTHNGGRQDLGYPLMKGCDEQKALVAAALQFEDWNVAIMASSTTQQVRNTTVVSRNVPSSRNVLSHR